MENDIIQSDTDIHEIFYNLLLDVALTENHWINLNNPEHIRYLIKKVLQSACNNLERLTTAKGTKITAKNIPTTYINLFQGLNNLRELSGHGFNPEYVERYYDEIIKEIENRQTFSLMIENIKKFIIECTSEHSTPLVLTEISVDSIRQTFYNIMAEMTIISGLIPKDDLISQESYIYFGLSSFAIIESVLNSKDCQGIRLFNGAVVTSLSCPPTYKNLFEILIKLKIMISSRNLSEQQVQCIRLKTLQNPDILIPDVLTDLQKIQINDLVSMITDISINISQFGHFKEIIDDVIKFCISAL